MPRKEDCRKQLDELARIVEESPNEIYVLDVNTLRFSYANESALRNTGFTLEELRGRTPLDLVPAFTWDGLEAQLSQLRRGSRESMDFEALYRRKDGSTYPALTRLKFFGGGSPPVFVAFTQDITERKRHEEQLSYLGHHDHVTGLPNRRLLERALERVVANARRGSGGALLYLDLDNFKVVNDNLGHAKGDSLLVNLGHLLNGALRKGDLLARWGGDEFAVLLEETSNGEALAVAERLRRAVEEYRLHMNGHTYGLSLSIGVALIDGNSGVQELLVQADTALYAAKARGGNCLVLYREVKDEQVRLSEASQWAARIKDALREDRLVLFFQPIVQVSNGEVEHYEALVRMREKDDEIILPGVFLQAAERFGLMPQVDRWVVEKVLAILRADSRVRIFVNISGESLGDEALLKTIEEKIIESRVDPRLLGFEITETTAVREEARTRCWIERLKNLGCSFALDDFGAGFSSFSYLRSLPVDYVKIDGSFVKNLDQDLTHRALVQAIYNVARALGKRTISEYVENEAVLRILRELGVDYGQGFFLGRPGPETPFRRN
ncbi:MAG: EAL domain-containing protein [Firmicutes bacterium]|nr:EAL domain-containing protein [Bacillota bacterium]